MSLDYRALNLTDKGLKKDFDLLITALDASGSGIIITNNCLPDNPIIYCNKAFENMTGYHRYEVIGHNCRFLQSDDRNQPERFAVKEAIATGEDCVVELRNYRKDGSLFYNELYLSPIKDDEGIVTFFIGVQNDISRRKRAEMSLQRNNMTLEERVELRTQDLKDSETFLNSIIQTVRESLIVLDKNFEILSVNQHFIKTFNLSAEETVGSSLFEVGQGQWNIPAFKELLEKILPSNNPVEEFEFDYDLPEIGKKVMILNAHRIEIEGQYKDQILIAIEDVTTRREIERRKDDFLSLASHELKTPLTTIKGLVQLIQRMKVVETDKKLKAALVKTSIYIDRLGNLVTELLDVSKIQSGKIELHQEKVYFDNLVKDAVEMIQHGSDTHVIEILGHTEAVVLADESHIVQVVINLISNAIKYSPNTNTVEVHISAIADFVKLSVKDYGVGIEKEEQKRIFERFYRVGAIQQKFPGMGVGLYICDQIIKNHKGTFWVESNLGSGSAFSFTLPSIEKHDTKITE